jgi:hypothetical protein
MTYLGVPSPNTVTHDGEILLGATEFTVQAVPYSYIGLSKDGVLHGAAYVDESGIAVMEIVPFEEPGTADIVISAQNRIPYISTIEIIAPGGPHVVFDSYNINDVSGNDNGLADAGENIILGVQVRNAGPDDAHNVTAILSSTDPHTTVLDNFESYGTVAGNDGTVYIEDAFSFDISSDAPDGHLISFQLEITGTALDTWISNFTIPVHAPVLEFVEVTINDAMGNADGILDPGEIADLVVTLANSGSGQASLVNGVLSEDNVFVTVADANGFFGDILPDGGTGDNAGDVFVVSVDAQCPVRELVAFQLDLSTDLGYSTDLYFDIIVGGPPPIPTLSEWGMIIMGLMLLALGTVAVIRRRRAIASEAD